MGPFKLPTLDRLPILQAKVEALVSYPIETQAEQIKLCRALLPLVEQMAEEVHHFSDGLDQAVLQLRAQLADMERPSTP